MADLPDGGAAATHHVVAHLLTHPQRHTNSAGPLTGFLNNENRTITYADNGLNNLFPVTYLNFLIWGLIIKILQDMVPKNVKKGEIHKYI